MTRLAARSISGSPEITGGIRPPARLSTLCRGVFLTASGRAFRHLRRSASSWQEDIASGRSPDAARAPADEAKHPGAAPAKARISPGARHRVRWPDLRPRIPFAPSSERHRLTPLSESPRLDAELLLAQALGVTRTWLVTHGPAYGWTSPSWAGRNGSNPEYWHFEYVG